MTQGFDAERINELSDNKQKDIPAGNGGEKKHKPRKAGKLGRMALRGARFDEDSISLYLKEISNYPLLTPDEEVSLAQAYKNNDYGKYLQSLI